MYTLNIISLSCTTEKNKNIMFTKITTLFIQKHNYVFFISL